MMTGRDQDEKSWLEVTEVSTPDGKTLEEKEIFLGEPVKFTPSTSTPPEEIQGIVIDKVALAEIAKEHLPEDKLPTVPSDSNLIAMATTPSETANTADTKEVQPSVTFQRHISKPEPVVDVVLNVETKKTKEPDCLEPLKLCFKDCWSSLFQKKPDKKNEELNPELPKQTI